MSYGAALTALADPTRRSILEQLRFGEQPAGELGRGLPMTQPAVSKHLRVLREAGLVRERRAGTRRIYAVERRALAELQTWIEGFWDETLTAFQAAETTYERDADERYRIDRRRRARHRPALQRRPRVHGLHRADRDVVAARPALHRRRPGRAAPPSTA